MLMPFSLHFVDIAVHVFRPSYALSNQTLFRHDKILRVTCLVSFYMYDRPLTGINVVAGFCAFIVWTTFRYCCFKAVFLQNKRN